MEQAVVTAITHDTSEAKVTVTGVPDRPGMAARLFRALADRLGQRGHDRPEHLAARDHRHLLHRAQARPGHRPRRSAGASPPRSGPTEVISDDDIARVSLVGAGMKTHPGVTATMFETLAADGINIEMISTSTIRLSCMVRADEVEEAVRSSTAPSSWPRQPGPGAGRDRRPGAPAVDWPCASASSGRRARWAR